MLKKNPKTPKRFKFEDNKAILKLIISLIGSPFFLHGSFCYCMILTFYSFGQIIHKIYIIYFYKLY